MCWFANARDCQASRAVRASMVHEIEISAHEDADLFAIELLIGELISNVARYTPGPFCSELKWRDDGRAELLFHDAGDCSLTVDRAMPAPHDGLERGRGIALMRTLGARLDVETQDEAGCLVRVSLPARLRSNADPRHLECPEGPIPGSGRACAKPVRHARTLKHSADANGTH